MANSDSPFGFRPVMHRNGSPWNGATQKVYWAGDTSVTLYVGDPVALSGTGDDNGYAGVSRVAAGSAVFGVVVGVAGDSNEDLTRDTPRFLSTTAGYALVARGDDLLFEVQEDSVGGALAKTNIGNTINHIFGTPSASHPIRSAAELDSSSADTSSATKSFRVEALVQREDNEIGVNANWLVSVNNVNSGAVN